jgi:murein DD-endopeptidase MepM/ murein hydrolase activator NlpD
MPHGSLQPDIGVCSRRGSSRAFASAVSCLLLATLVAAVGACSTAVPGTPVVDEEEAKLPPRQKSMRVTSGFGMRHDPLHGELRRHDGVDIAAPVGTPIRAPKDGVVRFAGDRGGYGNVVYLDHGDGTESRYAHCDAIAVRAGQVVRSGDVIASVGSTGRSTGPHLHLELRANGAALDPSSLVPVILGGSGGLAPLDSTGELSSELP